MSTTNTTTTTAARLSIGNIVTFFDAEDGDTYAAGTVTSIHVGADGHTLFVFASGEGHWAHATDPVRIEGSAPVAAGMISGS